MSDQAAAEQQYEALVEALVGSDGVRVGSGKRGFGSDALTVNGRIFAMLVRGSIVLKLPRGRVSGLIASSLGKPFDAGKGRPMRQWVTLEEAAAGRLLSMAREARDFVAGRG